MFLKVKKIERRGFIDDFGDHGKFWVCINDVSISVENINEIREGREMDFAYTILVMSNGSKIEIAHTNKDLDIALKEKNLDYLINNFDEKEWEKYKKRNSF